MGRLCAAWVLTLALCAHASWTGPAVADLGTIRYRDPQARRSLWVGLELGGTYVPRSLGLLDRDVWNAHATPAWALALTSRVAVGGRHALASYSAQNVRLSLHAHELEASVRFAQRPATSDRLALGAELHSVDVIRVRRFDGGWEDFRVGGLDDTVLRLGYGQERDFGRRWRLAWAVQGRHAWLFRGMQRQLRASARLALALSESQRVALEGTGFLVNRDSASFGGSLAPTTIHGQAAVEYDWALTAGLSVLARTRALSSFMNGEAPLFELREESLRTPYAELVLGVRAVWD